MAALRYITSVLLLTLSLDRSESLRCFQCSQVGKYKCPSNSDSRTTFESIENQYIDVGSSSEIGCSLQIGYDEEIYYQGTMSLKDCTEKKSIYLTRVKNFTCCFGCDGCNWDLNTAFSSKCSGTPKTESNNKDTDKNNIKKNTGNLSSTTCEVDTTGFDYNLASLILLISTIILLLVVVVLSCILFNRTCCLESRPESPTDNLARNNIEPSNLSHYTRKHDSYE
ncbi:uncharacterized protein [Lepeophtheirus salmonis]|uniref:uncharacterized protein n=1 Tax=Lepeophtheirus salmonis TaxID=72036 RepID=UPI001AE646E6|nr:uncharacterized protein LOC121117937 [Lepeophtheirus salmonis]